MVAQWASGTGEASFENLQNASRWVYDLDGDEQLEVEAGKPWLEGIVKYWRPDGLLLGLVDADGSWTRYDYDDGGNQIAEISPTEDGGEAVQRSLYDIGGRLTRAISSEGLTTQNHYDLADRLLASTTVQWSALKERERVLSPSA